MYICRNCGGKVTQIDHTNNTSYCEHCQSGLNLIASWTLEARLTQLKAMHDIMQNANDEEIYMSWIVCGVPDEPSDEDFEYIAMDDESYNETFDLFVKLIKYDGNRW